MTPQSILLETLRAHHTRRDYPAELAMDTDLRDDLRMDSLDFVSVAMELEERFGIAISDNSAFAWRTVGDVVRSVERKVAA